MVFSCGYPVVSELFENYIPISIELPCHLCPRGVFICWSVIIPFVVVCPYTDITLSWLLYFKLNDDIIYFKSNIVLLLKNYFGFLNIFICINLSKNLSISFKKLVKIFEDCIKSLIEFWDELIYYVPFQLFRSSLICLNYVLQFSLMQVAQLL